MINELDTTATFSNKYKTFQINQKSRFTLVKDEEFVILMKPSSEYHNYWIIRDHKPSIVKKQFSALKKKTRSEAKQKQTKQDKVSDLKFITSFKPALPNMHNIIQNNLSILHTDGKMKKIFLSKSIKTLYRKEKNLKEMLSPFSFPAKPKNRDGCITSCKKWDICKKFLITNNKFKCEVTCRLCNVRGELSCNSSNVIYLIPFKNCEGQYIGSAIDFNVRFRIHRSDIKPKKDRCGTARHFNTKCSNVPNSYRLLQVQLIESVVSELDLENKVWEREKYWQCQLFTNTHDMNSALNLYASKRKGCRKNNFILSVMLHLVVRYHYCFMLGTITALCRLATAH